MLLSSQRSVKLKANILKMPFKIFKFVLEMGNSSSYLNCIHFQSEFECTTIHGGISWNKQQQFSCNSEKTVFGNCSLLMHTVQSFVSCQQKFFPRKINAIINGVFLKGNDKFFR